MKTETPEQRTERLQKALLAQQRREFNEMRRQGLITAGKTFEQWIGK